MKPHKIRYRFKNYLTTEIATQRLFDYFSRRSPTGA